MKRLVSLAAAVSLLSIVLTSCSPTENILKPDKSNTIEPNTTQQDTASDTYTLMAENDQLKLSINYASAAIRVEDKKSGRQWDTLAAGRSASAENSLFTIDYLDSAGLTASMSSYSDSVMKGQYLIEKQEDGAKIRFTLGNVQEDLFCPAAFDVERYEAFLEKISSRYDSVLFKSHYWLVDIEKISDNAQRNELLDRYPSLSEKPMYVLRENTLPLSTQREIDRILTSIGYTEEDYAIDSANAAAVEQTAYPIFNVNLYLTLDGNQLQVRIPVQEIAEYNGAKLTNLSVLRTFGSPANQEAGYFLLPDGSGSIMEFYNGRGERADYSVPVYGRDLSVPYDEMVYAEGHAYLPYWGIVYEDKAMLATIEEGEAFANIQANSGTADFLPYANALFRIRELSRSSLASSGNQQAEFFYITQSTRYDGDIRLSYTFFGPEGTDYNYLAKFYHSQLFGGAAASCPSVPPTYIEFIGTSYVEDSILGFKTQRRVTYTTLKQAKQIGEELLAAGVSPLVIKMTGFFNGGIDSAFPDSLTLNKDVGTRQDLQDLQNWAKDNGVRLYFDFEAQYVTQDNAFDGFSAKKDAAYFINRLVANKRAYNPATFMYYRDRTNYILNPSSVDKILQTLNRQGADFGLTGFSLRNAGREINSDFNESNAVDRQSALNRLEAGIAELKGSGYSLLSSGANQWFLPYASDLLHVPLTSSQLESTDKTIPFLQLVLGSSVPFADQALNLSGNTQEEFFNILQSGAGLYYTLTANPESTFDETDHEELYSTKYALWKQDIVDRSQELQAVYAGRSGPVESHRELAEGVYKTTYENGFYILVNYSRREYAGSGFTVPAGSYLTGKEAGSHGE